MDFASVLDGEAAAAAPALARKRPRRGNPDEAVPKVAPKRLPKVKPMPQVFTAGSLSGNLALRTPGQRKTLSAVANMRKQTYAEARRKDRTSKKRWQPK